MKPFLCSWLWLGICSIHVAAVARSDSVLNSLCDNQKCVCQINVSPGSNGCQSDDRLVQENARMNETIWQLQDEIRRLKDSKGNGKLHVSCLFACLCCSLKTLLMKRSLVACLDTLF